MLPSGYIHDSQLTTRGIKTIRVGGNGPLEVILRENNPYLRMEIQCSNKTRENPKQLSRRLRLGLNLALPIYQF